MPRSLWITCRYCLLILVVAMMTAGCSIQQDKGMGGAPEMMRSMAAQQDGSGDLVADATSAERLLIRSAQLEVATGDPMELASRVEERVRHLEGWVQSKEESEGKAVTMRVRVPERDLDAFLDSFEGEGTIKSRRVSATDVTDSYRDNEARIENLRALRTRLRELLERAETVDEMLRVERELARVQTELDMHEGARTRMGNQIAYSDVELTLREGRILGPVGAVLHGLGWGIRKLFVIR